MKYSEFMLELSLLLYDLQQMNKSPIEQAEEISKYINKHMIPKEVHKLEPLGLNDNTWEEE